MLLSVFQYPSSNYVHLTLLFSSVHTHQTFSYQHLHLFT